VTELRAARDMTAADWIVADIEGFGASVLSLVPCGFACYVRVFHPAYRLAGETLSPVRWEEIAAANGTRVHAAMQLHAVARHLKYLHERQPGVYDVPPRVGTLAPEAAGSLAEMLARHTSTPARCWFAVWIGFGALRADIRAAPTFHLPSREYHLLVGPVTAAVENAMEPPSRQSPNLWWPDDRSWCVATEIDLNSTYIGCDDSCADEILATPGLEAFAIDSGAGIDWRSDSVNPWPDEEPS
jgi:hypothetical protein